MKVIGDVHAKFLHLKTILDKDKESKYFQLGDCGIGFSRIPIIGQPLPRKDPKDFGDNFKFFEGNHDSHQECKTHKNFAGRYGRFSDDSWFPANLNGFFCGGAHSIDKAYRTEGLDWWADEELSEEEFIKAIDLYEQTKPDIMFSHDCPKSMYEYIIRGSFINNMTCNGLETMLKIHRPKFWIHAHHHRSFQKTIKGTKFICLAELEVLDLDTLNL